MGVVRDVTIDQLTQAVTGISTSGLSDSTGQAINSTLGTLGKDTSLQDIKTAINNLGSAISPSANNVTFDNTGTGLTASNVQSAIAEVAEVTTAIHYVKTTLTSNVNGYIDLGISSNSTMLLSVIANGVGAIPMQSGSNWWCILVNPSTMQPYPNLSRTIWYEYIDI